MVWTVPGTVSLFKEKVSKFSKSTQTRQEIVTAEEHVIRHFGMRMFKFSTITPRYVCYNIYKFHEHLRLHDFCKIKSKVKLFLICFPHYLVFYSIQR